jgi:predicted aldo/keto reductase-like oxidoreductase
MSALFRGIVVKSQEQDGGANVTRRSFLQGAAAVTGAVSASILSTTAAAAQQSAAVPNFKGEYGEPVGEFEIPKRAMGKTGVQVSILGMGGFHLGTVAGQTEVNNMVAKAMDHGVNFFDNAWEYHKGVSEERLGIALKGKRDKVIVMTKVCTHGRKKDVAMRMLEESLVRLQTDHLDVWQVHEVVYYNDPEKCYAADGVLEALTAAKQQGKVRFVGFTGHKNPSIHLEMLKGGYPFDTVQMPLNPFDYSYRSFQREVLPVAAQRGLAVFGMKSMGGSGEMISKGALTPTEALSFAMSLPGVSTTISGMDSMAVLDQNLKILRDFKPLTSEQMDALRSHGKQFNDGRYELFKSTVKYDGDVGRQQHDFPSATQLPA